MTMTDPIADMLTRIRNAQRASHENGGYSEFQIEDQFGQDLEIRRLYQEFQNDFRWTTQIIRIFLKYDKEGVAVIEGIKRISKPSCRIYRG